MAKRKLVLNKKIIVLGSTGMIGHKIYQTLKKNKELDVLDLARSSKFSKESVLVDALNLKKLESAISQIAPNIIINCIGILISESQKKPELAENINAKFPHKLKDLCDQINAKLIHMSTDCVFSGKKNTPYIEIDEKDGVDNYAITKSAGEIISDDHLTIRTSVIGPELDEDGEQLFNWFMNQKDEVNGYADAIWSGVTSLELAHVVSYLIKEDLRGLYHVTNGLPITKNELLHLFKKATNKKIDIGYLSGININKHFIDTRKDMKYEIPTYEEMIKEMVSDIENNSSLYSHYSLG